MGKEAFGEELITRTAEVIGIGVGITLFPWYQRLWQASAFADAQKAMSGGGGLMEEASRKFAEAYLPDSETAAFIGGILAGVMVLDRLALGWKDIKDPNLGALAGRFLWAVAAGGSAVLALRVVEKMTAGGDVSAGQWAALAVAGVETLRILKRSGAAAGPLVRQIRQGRAAAASRAEESPPDRFAPGDYSIDFRVEETDEKGKTTVSGSGEAVAAVMRLLGIYDVRARSLAFGMGGGSWPRQLIHKEDRRRIRELAGIYAAEGEAAAKKAIAAAAEKQRQQTDISFSRWSKQRRQAGLPESPAYYPSDREDGSYL